MTTVKPLAYGYLRLSAGAHLEADGRLTPVDVLREQLVTVARREGLTLAGVLCEIGPEDQRAFYAMVERVRADEAVAVIVPGLAHLSHIPALAGADRQTAGRYFRAAVLTVTT